MGGWIGAPTSGSVRPAAVAGMFYPASRDALADVVRRLFTAAQTLPEVQADAGAGRGDPVGILVPHAGLAYSGIPAAAAWSGIATRPDGGVAPAADPDCVPAASSAGPTVVLLGTNHRAGWLDGVAAWESGGWATPAGEVEVDAPLSSAILGLGAPFVADRKAHDGEHSLEVQLPLLLSVAPAARIVPLSVAAGRGAEAIAAGHRLGSLLAERRAAGERVVLAISTDMAHYPPAAECHRATDALLPPILGLDPEGLAQREEEVRAAGSPGLVCGMCGIEPAVLGLAALRAMGARAGTTVAVATSADAGGPQDRTVGYLAARFDRCTIRPMRS